MSRKAPDTVPDRTTPAAEIRVGRGEPLLLLHDLGLTWHSWGRCIEELADRHTVWAPTLPGHWGGPALLGTGSPAGFVDEVERMLDDAGLRRVHVAANGFGAWIAAGLADRGRVGSLTLISPAGAWAQDPLCVPAIREALLRRDSVAPLLKLLDSPVAAQMARRSVFRSLTGRAGPALVELCPVTKRRALITAAAPLHCPVLRNFVLSEEFRFGWRPAPDRTYPIAVQTGGRLPFSHLVPESTWTDAGRVIVRHYPDHGRVPMLDQPETVSALVGSTIASAPWLPGGTGEATARRAPRRLRLV
ncbi:alpha/beta fold hydrolase [Nocardia thailandica]